MACHYKRGKRTEITFVFSCPGKQEEKRGEPAIGVTGKNLDRLLAILSRMNTKLGVITREDITITNATTKVRI